MYCTIIHFKQCLLLRTHTSCTYKDNILKINECQISSRLIHLKLNVKLLTPLKK